ncbi:MAG: hypothetical protein WCF12_03515 [Propionicimonas sp.]
MNPSPTPAFRLRGQVALRIILALPVMMALLFLPAGTFAYWEAWTDLAVVYAPLTFASFWLLTNSPDLLARRMKLREPARVRVGIVSAALLRRDLPGYIAYAERVRHRLLPGIW